MRKHKISIDKVQEAFNAAIKRRDCRCVIRDFEPCEGHLECSHYYTVGSSPAIRFHPMNAWTQCQAHHWRHHHAMESRHTYFKWMTENRPEDLARLDGMRHRFIRYTDALKTEIIRLCNDDRLDELQKLIERELNA